jgi:hypothetical protein
MPDDSRLREVLETRVPLPNDVVGMGFTRFDTQPE